MLFDRLDIPETLRAATIDFNFRGARAHFAPSTETPLSRAMLKKTNAAVITLIAGLNLIVARRLESVADTTLLHQIAEVLLCFEAAPQYYSGYQQQNPTPDRNAAEEVITALFSEGTGVFGANPGKHSNFPPMQALKNTAALAELVLGREQRVYLKTFLTAAIAELDRLAANPDQVFSRKSDYETRSEWEAVVRRNFGTPVPIEALDPGRKVQSSELTLRFDDFLRTVDWVRNPYLSSLDSLRAEGSVANPYLASS